MWVVAPAAGHVLVALWDESVAARQERVGCLAGRLTGDSVYVDSARALPTPVVDSLTADGRPSIEGCGPPAWFGSVHTHIRSTDDTSPVARFSPGDRTVMSLWVERWGRRGAFCLLHGEHAAHCEVFPPELEPAGARH